MFTWHHIPEEWYWCYLFTRLFWCYRLYFLTSGYVCWDQYCISFWIFGVKMWACRTFWKVDSQIWKDSSYFNVWTVPLICEFAPLLPHVSVVNKFYQADYSSNGVKLYFRNTQFYLDQVGCSDSTSLRFSSSQTRTFSFLLWSSVFIFGEDWGIVFLWNVASHLPCFAVS